MLFNFNFTKLAILNAFFIFGQIISAVDTGGPRGVEMFVSSEQMADDRLFNLSPEESESMKQVEVKPGGQFHLVVVVNDDKIGDAGKPVIQGLDNFSQHDQPVAVHGVGGFSYGRAFSLIVYNYIITAKKEGTYKLGPAVVSTNDGRTFRSDFVTVVVDKSVTKAEDAFLKAKLFVDGKENNNKSIYVGQKLELVLELFSREDIYSRPRFVEQFGESSDFTINQQNGSAWAERADFVNGVQYNCYKKTIPVVALSPGLKELPRISCIFQADRRSQYSAIGFLGMISHTEQRILVANDAAPIVLDIKAIPENVDAVGRDFSIVIESTNKKLEVGQATTIKLAITGAGDFSFIETPELVIPEGCRCHNSGNYFLQKPDKDGKKTKVFEYVVQVSRGGELVFGPQKLSYFDIKDEKVVNLESNQLIIYVKKLLEPQANPINSNSESKEASRLPSKDKSLDSADLQDSDDSQRTSPLDNPWIFVSLLFLIMIIIGGAYNRSLIGKKYKVTFAYSSAKAALTKSAQSYEITAVYYIFLDYFAVRLNIDRKSIDVNEIYKALFYKQIDQAVIDEVVAFLEKSADVIFGRGKSFYGQLEISIFFKSALELLNKVDKDIYKKS